jgi:hypothetical protein
VPSYAVKVVVQHCCPGMVASLPSIVALHSPLYEELDIGEDTFMWPHPARSGEALFVVDDVAERARRKAASRGHEGPDDPGQDGRCDYRGRPTDVEAQCQMTNEVAVQVQVSLLVF